MKIAIATDNFYPELSGITDSIILFSKTLAEHGHEVLIIAPRYSKKNYRKGGFLEKELPLHKHISVIRLPAFSYPSSPTGQARAVVPTGYGALKIKKWKPDIIHTQTPFGAGIEALLASKFFKIPLVGTNHTPPQEFSHYSPFKGRWFARLTSRFFSWYYNHTLFTSAPSQVLLEEMKRYGLRTPSQQISNPLELTPYTQSEKSIHAPTILYTGRLAPEKHVDVILHALPEVLKEVPEAICIITGHGSAEKDLHRLASDLGIQKQVHFAEFVPDEKLFSLYEESDVFVMMSTAETQCLSMMHAMATGIPVIAANARALPEYVRPETGFLVEPGDSKTLAHYLVTLLKNPALRETLGAGGKTLVAQFEKEHITTLWESVYQKAIS